MEITMYDALSCVFVAFAIPFAFIIGCLAAAQIIIWSVRWNKRPKGDWK